MTEKPKWAKSPPGKRETHTKIKQNAARQQRSSEYTIGLAKGKRTFKGEKAGSSRREDRITEGGASTREREWKNSKS